MLKLFVILMYLSQKVFDAVIDFLNSRHLGKELPENVRDVYNEEEYKNWVSYERESGKAEAVRNAVVVAVSLTLFISNAFAWIFNGLSGVNIYLQYLLFTFIMYVISRAVETPFDYYDTFVIEEKYGLNRSSKKTFVFDAVKSFLINMLIAYVFTIAVMFLFERFGNLAILWCSAAVLVIVLAVMLIVVPLMRVYNRFEPLEDGELKDRLLGLCDKYGIRVRKIVVRDASRRTSTANAFCSGFGKYKTISLDDNLVNGYSPEEITAVFAHEFAHAKYHHTLKSLPFSVVNILLVFTALAIVLNVSGFYTEFGFTGVNYYFAVLLIQVVLWPVSTLMNLIGNWFSRKFEYQADAFAAREGYGNELISSLKRLHKESLSDINPHPAAILLYASHPTLSQRIDAIERAQAGD